MQSKAQARPSTHNKQNQELQQLLQTNKILIENKKNIYKTKIATFDRQIQKINKLLAMSESRQTTNNIMSNNKSMGSDEEDDENNSKGENQECRESMFDSQEKNALVNKLENIKIKRAQAAEKLSSIFKIEDDIKEFKTEQNNSEIVLSENLHSLNQERRQPSQKQNRIKQWKPINNKNAADTNINIKSRTQSVQLQFCPQNSYKIEYSKPNNSIVHRLSGKKRTSQPDAHQGSASSKKLKYKRDSQNMFDMDSLKMGQKYYVIEGSEQKIQEIVLWSENNVPHNSMEQSRIQMRQFRQQSMDKNNSIATYSQQREDKQKLQKKGVKNINQTPISITKKQVKYQNQIVQQFKQLSHSGYNEQIIHEQYTLLAEQMNNIIQNYKNNGQMSSNTPKLIETSKNDNFHLVFKELFETLVKIKHHCQKDQIMLQSMRSRLKQYKQKEVAEEKKNHEILREKLKQFSKEQQRQKQLKLHVMKLQHEKESIEKELSRMKKQWQDLTNRISKSETELANLDQEKYEANQARKQIEKNMQQVVNMYLQNFRQIQKDLNEAQKSISMTERQQNSQRCHLKSRKALDGAHQSLQECSYNISQMYEFIRSSAQAQKLAVLQNKQQLLSLEYQVNLLKSQQKRLQSRNKQLLQKLQKQTTTIKEEQAQIQRLKKQKNHQQQSIKQIKQQVEQYQNLKIIRKQAYKQLQSKYTSLKTKKQKIDKNIEKLDADIQAKEDQCCKLEEQRRRREKSLEDIGVEIKRKLEVKEHVCRSLQDIQDDIQYKQEKLSKLELNMQAKEQQSKKMEKQTRKIQQKLQTLSENQQKLRSKVQKLAQQQQQLHQNQKQTQQKLQQLTNELKITSQRLSQTQTQLKNIQAQLQQSQHKLSTVNETHRNMQSKVNQLNEEIHGMEGIKEELEAAIGVLLEKKQEAVGYLGVKYEELENMEQALEQVKRKIGEGEQEYEQKQNKIEQLQDRIEGMEVQKQGIEKQTKKKQQRLQNLEIELQQNREQQESLNERLRKLREFQSKLLLEIAMITFNSNSPQICSSTLSSILPLQTKQRIQQMLVEMSEMKKLRQLYEKQKQENRKLKLDNQRYRKLNQIEIQMIDMSIEQCTLKSKSRIKEEII